MSLYLHNLKPSKGTVKKKKRVGRGGKRGTYSGKGLKGQKARTGNKGTKRRGMWQLIESTHKLRGFKSHRPKPAIINLDILSKKFKDNDSIDPKILQKIGLIDKINNGVKILGKGEIKIKLNIIGCTTSKSVKEKIEKAGGVVAQAVGNGDKKEKVTKEGIKIENN